MNITMHPAHPTTQHGMVELRWHCPCGQEIRQRVRNAEAYDLKHEIRRAPQCSRCQTTSATDPLDADEEASFGPGHPGDSSDR